MNARARRLVLFGFISLSLLTICVYTIVPGVQQQADRQEARSELDAALATLDRLVEEKLEPTPLAPVTGDDGRQFAEGSFSATGTGDRPLRFTRDVTNESSFLQARGEAAASAQHGASILSPDRSDNIDECFRSLQHSISAAFPRVITAATDTRTCGTKVNAAVAEFVKEIRGLVRQ